MIAVWGVLWGPLPLRFFVAVFLYIIQLFVIIRDPSRLHIGVPVLIPTAGPSHSPFGCRPLNPQLVALFGSWCWLVPVLVGERRVEGRMRDNVCGADSRDSKLSGLLPSRRTAPLCKAGGESTRAPVELLKVRGGCPSTSLRRLKPSMYRLDALHSLRIGNLVGQVRRRFRSGRNHLEEWAPGVTKRTN